MGCVKKGIYSYVMMTHCELKYKLTEYSYQFVHGGVLQKKLFHEYLTLPVNVTTKDASLPQNELLMNCKSICKNASSKRLITKGLVINGLITEEACNQGRS